MHWTMPGAQAMLDVRSVYVNDAWEEYQAYRIERETERLYPNRSLFTGISFPGSPGSPPKLLEGPRTG